MKKKEIRELGRKMVGDIDRFLDAPSLLFFGTYDSWKTTEPQPYDDSSQKQCWVCGVRLHDSDESQACRQCLELGFGEGLLDEDLLGEGE